MSKLQTIVTRTGDFVRFIEDMSLRLSRIALMLGFMAGTVAVLSSRFNLSESPQFSLAWSVVQAMALDGLLFGVWSRFAHTPHSQLGLKIWLGFVGTLLGFVTALINNILSYQELQHIANVGAAMSLLGIPQTAFSYVRSVIVVLVGVLTVTIPTEDAGQLGLPSALDEVNARINSVLEEVQEVQVTLAAVTEQVISNPSLRRSYDLPTGTDDPLSGADEASQVTKQGPYDPTMRSYDLTQEASQVMSDPDNGSYDPRWVTSTQASRACALTQTTRAGIHSPYARSYDPPRVDRPPVTDDPSLRRADDLLTVTDDLTPGSYEPHHVPGQDTDALLTVTGQVIPDLYARAYEASPVTAQVNPNQASRSYDLPQVTEQVNPNQASRSYDLTQVTEQVIPAQASRAYALPQVTDDPLSGSYDLTRTTREVINDLLSSDPTLTNKQLVELTRFSLSTVKNYARDARALMNKK